MKPTANAQKRLEMRKDEIRKCATHFRHSYDPGWIEAILRSKGLSAHDGILAAYSECLDQGCYDVGGYWVTSRRRFFRFEASLHMTSKAPLSIDRWEDATDTVERSAHKPGIKKAFGTLALEVLEELCGKSTPSVEGDSE